MVPLASALILTLAGGTARIEDLIDELSNDDAIVIVTGSMQQAACVSRHVAFFHLSSCTKE